MDPHTDTDTELKDKLNRPPEPRDVLDGDYILLSSEDFSEEEEDGDEDEEGEGEKGDGQASLALDTPEPAPALATEGPAGMAKGKADLKGLKAKAGLKSGTGGHLGKASTEGLSADKSGESDAGIGMTIDIDEKAFGFEESADAPPNVAEGEDQALSAYDRDEVTVPEDDGIDPLQMILGEKEKPWENEKLSAAEKAALRQIYKSHDALEQQQQELEETDPKAKGRNTKSIHRVAAIAATVVAASALAAKTAQAAKGPSIAGVSRGPRRETDQERAQIKLESEKPAPGTEQRRVEARENATDVTLSKVDAGLASALGVGMIIGMPSSMELLYKAAAQTTAKMGPAETAEMQQQILLDPNLPPDGIAWAPPGQFSGQSLSNPDDAFMQALNVIYDGLGMETLMNVTPYRAAGWDEKRLEQKENSADITIAPPAPNVQAPAPEPVLNREFQMNLGPPGMS